MDGKGFDALTRKYAQGISRRTLLRGLIGGGAAVVASKASGSLAADKVTICHFPPGNPENVQIIEVGASAVAAHVANHGDFIFDECCVDSDCPGNECNAGVCNAGTCGLSPANEGGACDDENTCTEQDVCTGGVCAGTNVPVDCQVSGWGEWSACSAECDGGTQYRTRSVTTEPACEGAACPALEESRDCNEQPCQISCRSGADCPTECYWCNGGVCQPLQAGYHVCGNETGCCQADGICDTSGICTKCFQKSHCSYLNDACVNGVCEGGTCTTANKDDGTLCNGGECCNGVCGASCCPEGKPCEDANGNLGTCFQNQCVIKVLCPPNCKPDGQGGCICFVCTEGEPCEDANGRPGICIQNQCVVKVLCPQGYFPGQLGCQPCPVGSYSPDGIACIECKPGTYADDEGSISCLACAAGSAQALKGQESCLACEDGFYAPEARSLTCDECDCGGSTCDATNGVCTGGPLICTAGIQCQSLCPSSTNTNCRCGTTLGGDPVCYSWDNGCPGPDYCDTVDDCGPGEDCINLNGGCGGCDSYTSGRGVCNRVCEVGVDS